jgi:predicted N-acetyltransferase YhbS
MEIRLLTPADTDAVLRLRDSAGWNQTERDIRRLIELEPDGCFAACIDGQIVGTTTTTTYGTDLAWIGMVLVDPQFRRRGIATALMERALAFLSERGVETIKLDATPAGSPVYERFGFVAECMLERWSGVAPNLDQGRAIAGDWAEIATLDRAVFGTDRCALMQAIVADAGRRPIVARNETNEIIGYGLTRPGSRAAYIGPIIADNQSTARSLLAAALSPLRNQSVFIDVHLDFPGALELMREIEFSRQRELLRMRLGPNDTVGRSSKVLAIAGPEVG